MTDEKPPGARPPKIVVGVDGSAASVRALRWAATLATTFDADIEAVSVWGFPPGYGWSALPEEWDPRLDMTHVLEAAITEAFGEQRPARLTGVVGEGNAAKVILDCSKHALMVILGSRGHGGFAGLLLGSVSASVAEHATCPVLVVHGEKVPEVPEKGRLAVVGGAPTAAR